MATASKLRLGIVDDGRLVSSEEFADADFEDPWKYERVAGRLVVWAPSGEDHASVSEPWRDRLGAYRLGHPDIVHLVVSGAWLRVDGETDRIGDIGVYLVADRPSAKIPDRVPDVMFEFVSPGRVARDRDYLVKRQHYYKFGVREYVVIDRFRRAVIVMTRGEGDFVERTLQVGQSYESPLLPGLSIALADVS